MKSYRDHTLGAKERASLLLKEMSLDEKMAQINCVFLLIRMPITLKNSAGDKIRNGRSKHAGNAQDGDT